MTFLIISAEGNLGASERWFTVYYSGVTLLCQGNGPSYSSPGSGWRFDMKDAKAALAAHTGRSIRKNEARVKISTVYILQTNSNLLALWYNQIYVATWVLFFGVNALCKDNTDADFFFPCTYSKQPTQYI